MRGWIILVSILMLGSISYALAAGFPESYYKIKNTQEQLKKWKKESKLNEIRSKMLSKKYKQKIMLIDLNPHYTAGKKFPKSAHDKQGRKTFVAGRVNTKTKQIYILSYTFTTVLPTT